MAAKPDEPDKKCAFFPDQSVQKTIRFQFLTLKNNQYFSSMSSKSPIFQCVMPYLMPPVSPQRGPGTILMLP
jgi:hypothetical protein